MTVTEHDPRPADERHPTTGLRFFYGLCTALTVAAGFYIGVWLLLVLVHALTGRWA